MISVEKLGREHVSDIALIEQECFSQPWDEKSLELFLGDAAFGIVVTVDGRAVGYGGMICVLDEGQITNIAVLSEYRRRGFAERILYALECEARERGIAFLSLEVRCSNIAARSLYAKDGWTVAGERKNFYSHPQENAVVMIKEVD